MLFSPTLEPELPARSCKCLTSVPMALAVIRPADWAKSSPAPVESSILQELPKVSPKDTDLRGRLDLRALPKPRFRGPPPLDQALGRHFQHHVAVRVANAKGAET